jgi:hypothetical protein
MQVLVRVHTHQRASQAHGAQIPAIKLINAIENCRGHMSCIAERYRSPRPSKKKMPHSSRAGEGFGHAVLFAVCFHGINRNTGQQFSSELRGGG